MKSKYIDELVERYPKLRPAQADVENAAEAMIKTYNRGGKILVCGNGGSAADSDHIAGELLKGFLLKRPMTEDEKAAFEASLGEAAGKYVGKLQRGIPVISLPSQSAVLTAYSNDVDPSLAFAQLVFAYAKKGDMLIAVSTSGNSSNVVCAAETAKALGITTLALTGAKDSRLASICDITVKVPETETFKVQELHLPVYHALCAAIEEALFI